jgi:hypothetical protein
MRTHGSLRRGFGASAKGASIEGQSAPATVPSLALQQSQYATAARPYRPQQADRSAWIGGHFCVP